MHSSKMRTIHCSGHLSCHACPPPATHATSAMHAPLCTMHTHCHVCPPPHHACPLPHMPLCHACPLPSCTPPCHTCPPAMHNPLPYTPTTHAHACHACPPRHVDRMTDACENITFPRTVIKLF